MLLATMSVLDHIRRVSHESHPQNMTENALERSRGSGANTAVHTDELDSVPWLTLVYQVIVQDHVRTAWQLASWSSLGHFLDTDALVITESAETIFDLQRMPFFVCLRCNRGRRGKVGSGGRGITIFAEVEARSIGTIMDRLDHLRTNKGAACNDTLERDHMAKVRGAEGPRANVVIAKGTVKTDAESFAFNVVLVDIMYLLYDIKECVVKRGKKLYGMLEKAVRVVASIVA